MASTIDLWVVHGVFGALAIFVIFPLGILKFTIHRFPPWMPHWAVQSFGTVLLLITCGLGLFQSSRIHLSHQVAALVLVFLVLLQGFLGQGIGSIAKRTQLQSFIRAQHFIQGFAILTLGWWTVLSGLWLTDLSPTATLVIGLTTLTEITGLILYRLLSRWRTATVAVPKVEIHDDSDEDSIIATPMLQRFKIGEV